MKCTAVHSAIKRFLKNVSVCTYIVHAYKYYQAVVVHN